MEFLCTKKYLLLPASFHAAKKRLLLYDGSKLVFDLVVSLDYNEPDYIFPINMERFYGKNMRAECDCDMEISLEQAEDYPLDYSGKYRPLAHFTARRGWINDPNGLVYSDGKYRMYFQHNPAATTWENMHWGAAESEDLITWREFGDVLFPDELGTMFSGSAIWDRENASGLQKDGVNPILYFYTSAGGTSETSKGQPFTQCLALSYDGGRRLVRYPENPLIPELAEGNRDPKVIRYDPDGSYIMVLYLEGHDFLLLKSQNLLDWKELQRITLPEDGECPDFYPLAVDGDVSNLKWVFSAAADRYYIGSFDGNRFTPEMDAQRLNWGNSSYAAQSWSGLPDNRRVRTSFASMVIPGMPFGSCLNIPQEMKLKTVHGQLRLCAQPVEELKKLHRNPREYSSITITQMQPLKEIVSGTACDISLMLPVGHSFTLSLFGLEIRYDADGKKLHCLDREAPISGTDGHIALRLIFDKVYTEIYADEGSVFMGMTHILDSNLNRLTITGEDLQVEQLTVAELDSFY